MDRQVKEDGSIPGAERLLLAIEEGRTFGGIRNDEATEILRRSEETDSGAHERRLIKYAQESGCWFDLNNFVKDNDGKLYCIDPMIRLNSK